MICWDDFLFLRVSESESVLFCDDPVDLLSLLVDVSCDLEQVSRVNSSVSSVVNG